MGESHEKAFQTLKGLLSAAPALAYPVPGENFSDASGYGIGGVLSRWSMVQRES